MKLVFRFLLIDIRRLNRDYDWKLVLYVSLIEAIVKSIARENAEELFNNLVLKTSKLYQDKHIIRVQFEFFDHTILVMKYNCKNYSKTFYVHKN
jgi:hypothetical protein